MKVSIGVDVLFIFYYAIYDFPGFRVGVGFVTSAILVVVESAVKVPQDDPVGFFACRAIFMYVVPEVVWAVGRGGVNSE